MRSGPGRDYRITFGPDHHPIDFHIHINGPGGVPLSAQLGRAVKLHRKALKEIAEVIDISLTQIYRFLDGSRGLSQQKLDALCSFLGLLVEGPPVLIPSRVRGVLPKAERRIYRPRSAPQSQAEAAEKGEPSPPARPPSLYSPPVEDTEGDN